MIFKYYKHMDDLVSFEEIWCYNEALCSVVEGDLVLYICELVWFSL